MNTDKLKWILLGIFLILDGLLLVGISLGGLPLEVIAGICGIVAGILFLINR
jgi:glucose dehydrogenase